MMSREDMEVLLRRSCNAIANTHPTMSPQDGAQLQAAFIIANSNHDLADQTFRLAKAMSDCASKLGHISSAIDRIS